MRILQLTVHFHPNLGGVESHLLDLVKLSNKSTFTTFVLTYLPLTTKVYAKIYERTGRTQILRLPWIKGQFYKLVNKPIFEFLYLVPGLFVVAPIIILFFRPQVIHAHGLVAGFVAIFWGKLFFRKVVISTHSIYNFPKKGFYSLFVKLNFWLADRILTLSKQSKKEVQNLGVNESKVGVFTYWVDQSIFKPMNKRNSKRILGFDEELVVLFVGRLLIEKGVKKLIDSMKFVNKNVKVVIAGDGPLRNDVEEAAKKITNLVFVGRISQKELPIYYNGADVTIVPSTHEEGFGRIILESLSCGTPVIASDRGGIKEAMDDNVGRLIDINPQNIANTINEFYKNKKALLEKQKNAIDFSNKHYNEKNFTVIMNAYIS